jgi:hypothetical protein
MTRPTANYALDWLTFLLLACLAATGLLLHYSLPAGSGGNSVLSMTRHEWGDVHFWIALGFLGVIGVHLLLHSAWIKALTVGKTRRDGEALARGAGAGGRGRSAGAGVRSDDAAGDRGFGSRARIGRGSRGS